MLRRSLLKIGVVGTGVAATCGMSAAARDPLQPRTDDDFDLTISPAWVEMIDGETIYQLLYFGDNQEASPELRVREGALVTIRVRNSDNRPHEFYIPGVPASYIAAIQPGERGEVSFVAPAGGTYFYMDSYKDPLNRIMGLHGAFIVEPADIGRTARGYPTPYSAQQHNPALVALFEAFGNHPRFPGVIWRASLDREKLWLFSQTDPLLNARIAAGEDVDPATVIDNFLPRYFTINGLSGFDTAVHGDDNYDARAARIMPRQKQGRPVLLRCINAGLANHACHIHGNHCFEVAESRADHSMEINSNIYERDTWHLKPLQRIDMLLPFERPPDIPEGAWPPKDEPFPLRYVMHCHFELSQTAGGGNYPQGAVTHWEMTEPL